MGPNITLTAWDGLVLLGPFFALVSIIFLGMLFIGDGHDAG
jgi:hypothetical protein